MNNMGGEKLIVNYRRRLKVNPIEYHVAPKFDIAIYRSQPNFQYDRSKFADDSQSNRPRNELFEHFDGDFSKHFFN